MTFVVTIEAESEDELNKYIKALRWDLIGMTPEEIEQMNEEVRGGPLPFIRSEIPPNMRFTFEVTAGSEEELRTYTMALKRQVAMWHFEEELRKIWKWDEGQNYDQDTVEHIWNLWHESKSELNEEE